MSLTAIVSTTIVLAWCHFTISLVLNRCTSAIYNVNLFMMCAKLIVKQHYFHVAKAYKFGAMPAVVIPESGTRSQDILR